MRGMNAFIGVCIGEIQVGTYRNKDLHDQAGSLATSQATWLAR